MKHLSVKNAKALETKAKLLELRQRAEEGNKPTFERMTKCEQYRLGDQWPTISKRRNRDLGKHNNVINQILPTLDQIQGDEVRNPRDITVYPLKGSTETRAHFLSALLKHALDAQQYHRKSSQMFTEGTSTGRGYLGCDRDYKYDPDNGDLAIRHPNPFLCLPDPGSETYDYNATGGCAYFIEDEWIHKERMHSEFMGRKRELEGASYTLGSSLEDHWLLRMFARTFGSRSEAPWTVPNDYRDTSMGEFARLYKAKDNYRSSIYWVKGWKKGAFIHYPEIGRTVSVYNQEGIDREAKFKRDGKHRSVTIKRDRWDRPVAVPVLYRHLMVGDVYLEAIEDPFDGVMDIPYVRFAPYFSSGFEMSLVQNLIGAQDALNWADSNILNTLKRMMNRVIKVARATQPQIDQLRADIKQDNYVIVEDDYGGKVEFVDQQDYPANFDVYSSRKTEDIARISGIRREDPTFDAKNQSGRAILAKQNAAQIGSAPQFMMYDWARENLGTQALQHIIHTGIYTRAEIEKVVQKSNLLDPDILEEARTIIKIGSGLEDVEMPEPPDETILIQMPPEVQANSIRAYRQETQAYNAMMDAIDELAEPMAIDMFLDETANLNKGQYGVKVDLSEASVTFKAKQLESMLAVSEVLAASGEQGLSRDTVIKASELPGSIKEAELARTG